MSQAKVEQYKKDKKNRGKIFRKERRERLIASIAGIVVLIAVVIWCGISVYHTIQASSPTEYTEVNLDALNSYTDTLS